MKSGGRKRGKPTCRPTWVRLNNIASLSGAVLTGIVQNGSHEGWSAFRNHPLRPGPTQPGTPQPCGRAPSFRRCSPEDETPESDITHDTFRFRMETSARAARHRLTLVNVQGGSDDRGRGKTSGPSH